MVDLIELRQALKELRPHQNIFRVLKGELKLKGYWTPCFQVSTVFSVASRALTAPFV